MGLKNWITGKTLTPVEKSYDHFLYRNFNTTIDDNFDNNAFTQQVLALFMALIPVDELHITASVSYETGTRDKNTVDVPVYIAHQSSDIIIRYLTELASLGVINPTHSEFLHDTVRVNE